MPNPELEAASALLAAAREDEATVTVMLGNAAIVDRVIGFHAQQAVEKRLKAVLASRGIDYPFTHDLGRLLDLIGRDRIDASGPVARAEGLTPWATELRYGGEPDSKIDRVATLEIVRAVGTWADAEVAREAD